jgi:hypothetical protein
VESSAEEVAPEIRAEMRVDDMEQHDIDKGLNPLFLEYECKPYDISPYEYDIYDKCFLNYTSKN